MAVCKKDMEELKAENKKLKNAADEGAVAVEMMEKLQKQHDLMVKENTDLKAALFYAESTVKSTEATPEGSKQDSKKTQVIDEIRQILAEVIYAYKTMGTNAKQFITTFDAKKDKAREYLAAVEKVSQMKKREDQVQILKALENDTTFLKAFPAKADQIKQILACLAATVEKKTGKVQIYDEEVQKFNTMATVAANKVTEYEERLALYY